MYFGWMKDPTAWIGLITLVLLEIVLGIDNIVFISILSGKLRKEERSRGRKLGITLAVIPRLILLLFLGFVLGLNQPILHIPYVTDPDDRSHLLALSWQDLIVICGGIFLLWNSTHEIHTKLEGDGGHPGDGSSDNTASPRRTIPFAAVIGQIMVLNIVFSLDSIITAIGMIPREQIVVMMLAVIISTAVMSVTINPVSRFVERHPSIKMLALSFLLLIGMTLVGEGFHAHIAKGYVYFAMGFSVFVELLNLRVDKTHSEPPVVLREARAPGETDPT
jgi:predicted tellurium resistance membrane protein TerC